MLNKEEFDEALEVGWRHAIDTLYNSTKDNTVLIYCSLFLIAEEFASNANKDVDEQPYFDIRQFCIKQLMHYYDKI